MSAITEEIVKLESELHQCFSTDSPINPKNVKRLCELRVERAKELVGTHEQRSEMMKAKTRELTAKLPRFTPEKMKLHMSALDRLYEEQDRYDKAAVHWVISESCTWEISEAYLIAAGILIIADEIR